MKKIVYAGLLIGLFFIAACNNSKVTSSWKANNAVKNSAHFQKIIVVAILPDNERTLQPVIEAELAKALQEKGINAVSSYQVFGPGNMGGNDKPVSKKLKKNGYDAVQTVVLLNKDKEKNYTPGSVDYAPYGGMYYGRFGGYYSGLYSRVYTPGYYTVTNNYFWESNLYDLKSDKLLYSVQSESTSPSSAQNLAASYSKKVVEDMIRQGLVAK